MTDKTDMEPREERRRLAATQHFLMELEQGVRVANREIIHQQIPRLTRDSILALSVVVGKLRARYLKATFALCEKKGDFPPDEATITALRQHREMFEEAREAYEALRVAVERRYIDIDDS
jgi:hypothetical protein